MNSIFQNRKLKPTLTVLLGGLVLLALVASLAPVPAQAAPLLATCSQKYTVQAGDTLSSIAFTFGVSVEELASANNLKSPYTIFVGDVLCIPTSATSDGDDSDSSSTKKNAFTFERDGEYITIKGSNLSKKQSYYVKTAKADRKYPVWYKVGLFNNNKNTTLTVIYRLPKSLRDYPDVQVCVKNGTNDLVYCSGKLILEIPEPVVIDTTESTDTTETTETTSE